VQHRKKRRAAPQSRPPQPCTPPGYWMEGACTRTNDRLSNMANPTPVPAKRTLAMFSPETQRFCCTGVGLDGADSTRLSVSPDASSASMNAVLVPSMGGLNGVAPIHTSACGSVNVATIAPNAVSLKSDATPSGHTVTLF